MSVWLMIFCALCGRAYGQFENGIIFDEGKSAIVSTQILPIPYIVNNPTPVPICRCVILGTCTNSGNNGIDIRIVNTGSPQPAPCGTGFISCCTLDTKLPLTDGTCGVRKIPTTPQSVVGQAPFGAYPWHAMIITKQSAFIGSGVLLDATHVLTAAHKVAAYAGNVNDLLVRLGDWNGRSSSEPYQSVNVNVARISIHPNYNTANLENDVAIIRLNGLVPIAAYPNINTACRPAAAPVTGTRCYVSGWGKNMFGPTGSYQSIMREVDVPILDSTDCENRFRQTRLGTAFVLNRNSFLCAGGEVGKDACTGDGGSPLVCQIAATGQWQVVGLVAWGIGCANPGVPGVYTNVFNFLPWINQMLATA